MKVDKNSPLPALHHLTKYPKIREAVDALKEPGDSVLIPYEDLPQKQATSHLWNRAEHHGKRVKCRSLKDGVRVWLLGHIGD